MSKKKEEKLDKCFICPNCRQKFMWLTKTITIDANGHIDHGLTYYRAACCLYVGQLKEFRIGIWDGKRYG